MIYRNSTVFAWIESKPSVWNHPMTNMSVCTCNNEQIFTPSTLKHSCINFSSQPIISTFWTANPNFLLTVIDAEECYQCYILLLQVIEKDFCQKTRSISLGMLLLMFVIRITTLLPVIYPFYSLIGSISYNMYRKSGIEYPFYRSSTVFFLYCNKFWLI